jgi:hypothetical protein
MTFPVIMPLEIRKGEYYQDEWGIHAIESVKNSKSIIAGIFCDSVNQFRQYLPSGRDYFLQRNDKKFISPCNSLDTQGILPIQDVSKRVIQMDKSKHVA